MNAPRLTIVTATAEHVDACARMFFRDMEDLKVAPSLDALIDVTRQMLDQPGTVLRVALVDDTPVGVILANEFLSIKFPGKALWLEELYVMPEHRRGGVGRQLVEQFVEWAHRAGYMGIELEAYRMNTAASMLYRSVGFRRLARERYSCDLRELEVEDAP